MGILDGESKKARVGMERQDERLRSLSEANDRLMAKNHALAKALTRATQELTKPRRN